MIFSRLSPALLLILGSALRCVATVPAAPGPVQPSLLAIDPDAVAIEAGEPAGTAPAEHHADGAAPVPAAPHTAADNAGSDLPPTEAEMAQKEIASLQKIALSLTEREDWLAAEIAFHQVLNAQAAGPADLARAMIGLARMYRRQGALTKAAALYERFLKDYPGDGLVPDALLELGRTHRALGASQLAIAKFYSVINSTIKLPTEGSEHYQMLAKTAQFEIAETHFLLGNFTDASKFYTRLRLLDLAPADRARAHFKSAYALHLGKDHEGAVTSLHAYLEQWPGDEHVPEARYLLSLTLRSLGRPQEALEATLQLLRTQQAGGDAKTWAYWQRRTGNQLANDFFQNGDTASALAVYHGLASLAPDPNWRLPITYQIALCHERLRQSELAIAAYQSIVDGIKPAAETNPAAAGAPGAAARPTISVELTELARMAAWRLNQLQWSDQTDRQLSTLFSSGVTTVTKSPSAPTPSSANDQSAASSPAPAGL